MGDAIKSFGEVNGSSKGSGRRELFVEANSNFGRKFKEGGGGGVHGFKTMLSGVGDEGFFEVREEESF